MTDTTNEINNNTENSQAPENKKASGIMTYVNDAIAFLVGAAIYALSVDMFTAPNDIAPGGVTGIATILHSLFGWRIGTMMFIINIPIVILGLIFIGWKYIGKSLFCLALVSAAIDLLAPYIPEYTGNVLLAAIFGGIVTGLSLGIVFARGGSTGGTDIVARLFGKLFPHVTQGRLILIADLIVVCAAGFIYGLEQALYALVAIFTGSFVIDRVLYGNDQGKIMYIITQKLDETNRAINEKLERGTTLLNARGGYSGGEREVIMCAVRNREAYKIRALVKKIDPNAFIIVSDAAEILGNGFRPIEKNEFGESDGQ